MSTITHKILKRILGRKRGWVFTPKDFLDIGSRAAIDQTLSRLVKQRKIRRLRRGLYDYPRQHATLGVLSSDTNCIVQALAKRSGDTVSPSGATAANLLGLSPQVPAKTVYVTNGPSRTITVDGRTIIFKHTHIPLMSHYHQSDKMNYLLQALSYLGKDDIDDHVIKHCASLLTTQDMNTLHKFSPQMPGWITDILHKIKSVQDEVTLS